MVNASDSLDLWNMREMLRQNAAKITIDAREKDTHSSPTTSSH